MIKEWLAHIIPSSTPKINSFENEGVVPAPATKDLFLNQCAFFSAACSTSNRTAWVEHGGSIAKASQVPLGIPIHFFFVDESIPTPCETRLQVLGLILHDQRLILDSISHHHQLNPELYQIIRGVSIHDRSTNQTRTSDPQVEATDASSSDERYDSSDNSDGALFTNRNLPELRSRFEKDSVASNRANSAPPMFSSGFSEHFEAVEMIRNGVGTSGEKEDEEEGIVNGDHLTSIHYEDSNSMSDRDTHCSDGADLRLEYRYLKGNSVQESFDDNKILEKENTSNLNAAKITGSFNGTNGHSASSILLCKHEIKKEEDEIEAFPHTSQEPTAAEVETFPKFTTYNFSTPIEANLVLRIPVQDFLRSLPWSASLVEDYPVKNFKLASSLRELKVGEDGFMANRKIRSAV